MAGAIGRSPRRPAVRPDHHLRSCLPGVRRRHVPGPAGRPRLVHRRGRAGRDRRGSLRRLVAGGRLPLPVDAAAQPHCLRRPGRRRAERPSAGHHQRFPDAGQRTGQRPGRSGGVRGRQRLDRGSRRPQGRGQSRRNPAGDPAVAGDELLQRCERRQRHSGHGPDTGRPEHARLRHQELRRPWHPRQQPVLGHDRPGQHQRAVLPRCGDHGYRRVRSRLQPVDEIGRRT